jgi:hypothetical protein
MAMNGTHASIVFTLQPERAKAVHVRLRRIEARWLAEVSSPMSSVGVGASARQALTAALQPLGDVQTHLLLADLGLLEPSVAVLAVEAEARSA